MGHLCDIKKNSKAIFKNSKPVSEKNSNPYPLLVSAVNWYPTLTIYEISAVHKNTIHRTSMKKVQSANDAVKSESQSLKAHSYINIPGGEIYSAAEYFKRVLEMKEGEGVKSEEEKLKRENERGIKQRYFHVRDISQTLDGRKCQNIYIPYPDVSFKDMYHYYNYGRST